LQLGFYSAETRVRGHITRLNPELAKGIEELVAVLDADRSDIAAVLSAGVGRLRQQRLTLYRRTWSA
jgi:hypothetical protein